MIAPSATLAWLELLNKVYHQGHEVSPRGMLIKEILACSATVDLDRPIVNEPRRELGYKFMAAEAAWILSGDNKVSTISPYARHIKDFSDDGVFYFGAYGPKIIDQLPYVCQKLAQDRDTRQAVLTIWRETPPATKDVPCTISVQWFIRDGDLHCIDVMRSSDLWLGWPYDIFNFSMLTHYIRLLLRDHFDMNLGAGTLTLVAGSQHIYERNFEAVERILSARTPGTDRFEGLTGGQDVRVSEQVDDMAIPGELIDNLWMAADEPGALKWFSPKSGE